MTILRFPATMDHHNPLNDMEDLLESAGYEHTRESDNRLRFLCESKYSCYAIILEWHVEYDAVRCSVVMHDCTKIDDSVAETAIDSANAGAWHGFFMRDGVGHIAFKTIVKLSEDCPIACMGMIEDAIDRAIEEADRLYMALSLDTMRDTHETMFPDDDWRVENLTLMFSDPKGNA